MHTSKGNAVDFVGCESSNSEVLDSEPTKSTAFPFGKQKCFLEDMQIIIGTVTGAIIRIGGLNNF
jgi:hypothetical protein